MNCISKFVDYLLGLPEEKKYFINAFNGANFDHYMFYHEFLKRGLTPEKFILNNGSLIRFQYKNLHLFDIAKHLGIGKLSDQLNAYKCDVVKGEFDHDNPVLINGWEEMPEQLQKECIIYLKSDVMGIKELY